MIALLKAIIIIVNKVLDIFNNLFVVESNKVYKLKITN